MPITTQTPNNKTLGNKKFRLVYLQEYNKSGSRYTEVSVERPLSRIRNPAWVSISVSYYLVSYTVYLDWWSEEVAGKQRKMFPMNAGGNQMPQQQENLFPFPAAPTPSAFTLRTHQTALRYYYYYFPTIIQW